MWNYRRVISRPCPIVDLCIRRCGRLCNQGRRTGSHSVPRFCAGHSERRPETAWQPMDSSISAGFLGTVKLQTCISANQNVNACFLLFFFISSITAYVFFNLMEWWGGLLGKDRPIPLSKRFRFSGSCCSGSIFTQKKNKNHQKPLVLVHCWYIAMPYPRPPVTETGFPWCLQRIQRHERQQR